MNWEILLIIAICILGFIYLAGIVLWIFVADYIIKKLIK